MERSVQFFLSLSLSFSLFFLLSKKFKIKNKAIKKLTKNKELVEFQ